jgi:LPS-assembly lipoprotein
VSRAYLEYGRGTILRVAPRIPRRAWRVLFALALSAALAACGFHLSTQPTLPFKSLYISAHGYASFAAELKRYIASSSPEKLADRPEDAEVVLQILSENAEAVILSLTTAGRVAEYQLRYRVSYRLHDNANRDWIPTTDILLRRDLTYQDQEVLAKENESNLLYQGMREDAVRQMVRRLSQARAPS